MKRYLLVLSLLGLALVCPAQQVHNAAYPYEPAFQPLPEAERGEIINLDVKDSEIYPGTRRNVKVYVPKQYDGKTPACLLVCMDGILYKATTVMDNLIKSAEIPVMIGIFIQSGSVYGKDGKVVRYNRSNEFDRVDGTFARFIEKEIIPLAESQTTSDGRRVLISKDANDRAITGASSGAICAFTAAWVRPDMFSRVYSSVGTFVSMRGGHDYPAIIRKTEPKRLRIFLQDGVNDAWNPLFGEWWEANQLMESALDFAGYELSFKWDRGGHSTVHGTAVFPDAMRWLWKGWPSPVGVGKSRNDMLKSLLNGASDWKLVRDGVSEKALLSPADSSAVYVYTPWEQSCVKLEPGVAVGAVATDGAGVADGVGGADGAGVAGGVGGADGAGVADVTGWVASVVGKKDFKKISFADPLRATYPGGVSVAVVKPGSNWIWNYILENGELKYGEEYYWIHGEGRQICFDTAGNLYVATDSGVQVCDHNGRVRAILSLPSGKIQSLAFVGHSLFVISNGKIFVRQLAHTGCISAFDCAVPRSQGQG